MATLYFKVSSDWDQVVKLRQECERLEAQLKKMDVNKAPAAARALETQLAASRQQMMGLVTEAAKAGAVMERDFKNGIYNASQTVNNLSANITSQKGVIRQLQNELTLLKEKYRETVKSGGDTSGMFEQVKVQTNKLREQKDVLFGLTQQQAEARLAVKKLKDEYAAFKEEAGETVESNEKISVSLTKMLSVIGGAAALKNFVTELVNVRGQFQQLEIAFSTMLKSKEKADKLMTELVDIAAKTPFDLQGVASSAKQMIAYGSSAEDVGDELVMLGNVAAGVGSQLSEIAYLYGTLRTQGRAYATDIRQFAGRGIPIYEELAKVLGVTKDEVSGLVTAGKVGFKEVEQAFKNMTSESGIYYNLMQEQSKSLTGQLSNLGDAWDTMLNKIGKDTEGIASAGISALKGLIENYETVGKVLLGLIATYGTYKTALIITKIAQDTLTARMEYAILVTKAQIVAQKALNLIMSVNPYAAIATIVVATSAALLNYANNADKCKKGIDAYNKSVEEATRKETEHRAEIEKLLSVAQNEQSSTEDRKEALIRLEQKYPDIFKKYKTEADMLRDILNIKKQINEEDERRRSVADEEELQRLNAKINKLNEAIKFASQSGAGLSIQSLVNEKNNLIKHRDLKQEEVNKKKHDEILSDLSGYSNEQLQKEVDVRERLIKRLENAQNLGKSAQNGKISNGILPGIKTNELLQAEKQAIERELNNRNKKNNEAQNKKYWEDKKKEAEAARDALDVSEENSEKWNRYTKQIKEAQTQIEKYVNPSATKKDLELQKKEQQSLSDQIISIEIKNVRERVRQQESLENQVTQSKIDAMDDGFEKEKAQMELNHRKELQDIGRQRQEYVDSIVQMEKEAFDAKEKLKASKDKNYHTKTFDRSSVNVDTSVFDLMSKNVRDKQQKEISDFYKKSLSEYQDYITKYNATREKFSKKRERYKQAGASDAQLKELNYQEEETLKAIDNEFASREKSFNSWADSVINLSLDKLRELLNQAYQELMNMEIKNPNDQNLAKVRAKVNTLRKAIGDKEVTKEISPGKATKDWDKLYRLLTDVNTVFEDIGDTVGGTFGDIISLAGGITSSSLQAISAIKGINAEMSALDKASAILAVISAGMKIMSGIGDFIKEKFGADYSEYESLKSQYETLISVWDELIDKKMEYISIDYGVEAQKAADEAVQLVKVQIERQRQLIKQLAASGSGIGSHSLGYRINDRLSVSDYDRISKLVGQKITAEYQLWDLTSKQMGELLKDEKFVSVLSEVNSEFVDYIQNIVQYEEQLEEIANKEKEALTGIGLDDFKSGYIDLLSDLDSKNEDFADNFEKYLQKAIFSSLIANKYKSEIENLYNQWAADSESGGRLTSAEADKLRQMQEELTDRILSEREQIMKDFGWQSSSETAAQQASKAVTVQASQESIDEQNGRLLAIQETGYKIETANQQQAVAITEMRGSISALTAKASGLYNIADETRTILANSYLELQQIRENTGEIVKPIKQIQADIAEVKQNTSRL